MFENRIPPNLMILIGLPYSLKNWIGDFWLYKAYLPTDIGKNYSYWVQIFTDFVLVLCILASTQMANDLNLGMVNNGFVQTSGVQNDKCMMSVNSSIFLGWSFWHILTILKFNCDGGFSEVRRTTRNKSLPIEQQGTTSEWHMKNKWLATLGLLKASNVEAKIWTHSHVRHHRRFNWGLMVDGCHNCVPQNWNKIEPLMIDSDR